jgi:hypothetical protein
MKPDTPPSWQTLAAAGRREFRRAPTAPAAAAEPAPEPIAWLPELAAHVHAGFLRQIWRRWALAGLLVAAGVLAFFLLAERLALPGNRLPSPRIPIPEAP